MTFGDTPPSQRMLEVHELPPRPRLRLRKYRVVVQEEIHGLFHDVASYKTEASDPQTALFAVTDGIEMQLGEKP
jgi:hypothetical protein